MGLTNGLELLEPSRMRTRTRSEGCLMEPSPPHLMKYESQDNELTNKQLSGGDNELMKGAAHMDTASDVEMKLLDVLRNNLDIVSALAKIDCRESAYLTVSPCQMRGPPPRNFTSSPKPMIHRRPNLSSKCFCDFEHASSASNGIFEAEAEKSIWNQMTNEVKWFLYDIAEAFETPWEEPKQPVVHNQKLSAVALHRDLKRCYIYLHPVVELAAAVYDTLLWKNPIHTLLLAVVYTYSIARGWIASLILLLLWTQLSLNYLKATKNIDIGLNFLPRKEVAMPQFDISGAQVILDVAKTAQSVLNFAANFLEKLHSLLTWKECRVTLVFYCLTIYWLVLTLIFSTGTCLGMCGITLGVRIFITTYLFHRFPRLRKRLDIYGWFYRNLPVKSTLDNSPLTKVTAEELNSVASRTNSPLPRRHANLNGVFASRLGSNFNLDNSGSQFSLNSSRSLGSFAPKHSALDLTSDKGSVDGWHEQSNTLSNAEALRLVNNPSESPSVEPPLTPIFHRPYRSAISPLATENPGSRSLKDMRYNLNDEEGLRESTSFSVLASEEHEPIHEDPMVDNVLAYRSCIMNDKEKTFPKGISSGILYLTDNALIYRSKSTTDYHASTIMLFGDVISIKKIQSLRTMRLLTGTRKSIEISIKGRQKPLQFIGIAQRDDFCSRIESVCADDTGIRFL